MAHEYLVVLCKSGNSYRSYERKVMLRYRPLSKACSIDNLFISLNNTCGIRHCTLNNSSGFGSVAGSPIRQLLSLRARIKINS